MAEKMIGSRGIEPKKKKQRIYAPVCYDEVYSLYDLALELSTEEKAVEFCKTWGLLPQSAHCPTCGQELTKYFSERLPSKVKPFRYLFRCLNKACRKAGKNKVMATKNTFFQGVKISFRKSLVLIYLFSRKSSIENAVWETSGRSFNNQTTSMETVYDVFSSCRHVCKVSTLYDKDGVCKKIGGVNCIVEIDGTKFGKKSKCVDGKKVVEGHWAFGGICRETHDCFLVPVEDRTEDNLIKIIMERVERGTTIITDCFTSSKLEENGYKHVIVNENNVDPSGGGIHLIESTLCGIKQTISKLVSHHRYFDLGAHLAEYIWRKEHEDKEHHFVHLLRDIAKVYPGPNVSTLSLQII